MPVGYEQVNEWSKSLIGQFLLYSRQKCSARVFATWSCEYIMWNELSIKARSMGLIHPQRF